MKIDLHCHTKKTKSGDSESRNVDPITFSNVLSNNGISIVAITNHNYFDLNEYNSFKDSAKQNGIQVWPGVELDVNIGGECGHLLVISNPDSVTSFCSDINDLINKQHPDSVVVDYFKLIDKVKDDDVIFIAHYALLKQCGFSDKSIALFKQAINDPTPVLLEPSSLKSVGIMEANGFDGFIGSDVKDWNNYPSNKIPTLKLRVKDYRTFKLLLNKDRNVVDSFINQKSKFELTIQPFAVENDYQNITLPFFNDVNIIFGGKATGKSRIVDAIYKKYCDSGKRNCVSFYRATSNLEKYNEITKVDIKSEMFDEAGFLDCSNEIKLIKEYVPADVVSTDTFYKGFKSLNAKGKIGKFGFFRASFSYVPNNDLFLRVIKEYKSIVLSLNELNTIQISDYIDDRESKALFATMKKLKESIYAKAKHLWIDNRANELVGWTIAKMKEIGKIKSGENAIPPNTGICRFYSQLIGIKKAAHTISVELSKNHFPKYTEIGFVPENGKIYLCTNYYLNPEETGFDARKIKMYSSITISSLKDIKSSIVTLERSIFVSHVGGAINKAVGSLSCITTLRDCFFINSLTVKKVNDCYVSYTPSDGEKSMLQIFNVFSDDSKEVYILDEPELSVGHNYINEVIVPKIKDLAKLDKTIIISTHDANIAVRTLPLNTIYREYKKTYIGNLFIDELKCFEDGSICSWTKKSLDYLEGGEGAFNERGDSYGL